jgi:hypothetical protein
MKCPKYFTRSKHNAANPLSTFRANSRHFAT